MDFVIYLGCLGVGVVFVLFSLIAGHFFGGHDGHLVGSGGHAEAGADASDAPGVSAFSPTIIASFITTFGAFGLILSQVSWTRSPWVSAPLAIFGAFCVAAVLLTALRKLVGATQSSSESRVADLVGSSATVITGIPEGGVGEIVYVDSGTRYTAPAREKRGRAIPTGASVTITQSAGGQFFVSASDRPSTPPQPSSPS